MKSKRKTMIACFLVILLGIGVIYAVVTSEITFTNHFKTGSVDVNIDFYEVTPDGERIALPRSILPNENVSCIPRVVNNRNKGYVRVKFDIVMDKETPLPITTKNAYDINSKWIEKGEYFYYTEVMGVGEASDVFEGLHIPEEWTQVTGSGFTINATVDCIQIDNFEPDFTSDLPWGTVEIEPTKEGVDDIDYNIAKQVDVSPVMTYTKAKKLEGTTEDLFTNFDYYMAGDVYKDTLTMKNDSKKKIQLFFRTQNFEERDLLKQMYLTIWCEDKKIYEGDMMSTSLTKYEPLTYIDSGKSKEFTYEVKLPEESKNYYTMLKDHVIWQFKVVEEEDKGHQTGQDIPWLLIALAILAIITTTYVAYNKQDLYIRKKS